jgi:hypothetical protein
MPVRFIGGPFDGVLGRVSGFGCLVVDPESEWSGWYILDWRAGDEPDGYLPFRLQGIERAPLMAGSG